MRRTVVIDDALLREAQALLGTGTIRETVDVSLRQTVRQRKLRALAEALGTFDMTMTREELLRLREKEARHHLRAAKGPDKRREASRYLVDASAWLDALQRTPGRDALRARVRELLVADQVVTTPSQQACHSSTSRLSGWGVPSHMA